MRTSKKDRFYVHLKMWSVYYTFKQSLVATLKKTCTKQLQRWTLKKELNKKGSWKRSFWEPFWFLSDQVVTKKTF